MTIARWPNEGYLRTGKVIDHGSIPRHGDYSNRGATFKYDKERPENWNLNQDIWMYGFWRRDWEDQRLKVKNLNTDENIIKTVNPNFRGVFEDGRYYYFNILEEIDKPGEWYLDRKTGIL